MSKDALTQLAPTGVVRAGINLSNFLLVSGRTESGDPVGVAPDMARAIRASVPAAGASRHSGTSASATSAFTTSFSI